jgi:hypothetical protein
MEQLCRILKPLANIYIIIVAWLLMILNFYLFFVPLREYAASAGLKTTPIVLDMLYYYTPDEGYQTLTNLGEKGRDAFRLANYVDFAIPLTIFFALSLPNVAMGKGCLHIIGPMVCAVSDYIENIAEKYVLEIYPKRNDLVMTLACYAGLVKMGSAYVSLLMLIINGLKFMCKPKVQSKQKVK